jgi:undecaprenyl diphosphate synthase
MRFLRHYLTAEIKRMMKHGIRLVAIGNLRRLPPEVRSALRAAIHETRDNEGMTVTLAVSYGAREELTEVMRVIARDVEAGTIAAADVTEALISSRLSTAGIPDPDLLIRTSGELRVSNFLLWQIAYTEIYVTETLWPDFREQQFVEAIAHFQQRERRFGRTQAQTGLRAAH